MMKVKGIWWRKPSIHTEEGEKERKASWLELFYDLVFVAVIAQLSHRLSGDISLKGFIEYAALFVPAWWVWIGSTYYNERYEINDVSHRLFTFLKMIPLAAMAYTIHDATGKTAVGFALSYIAVRVILIIMWLRAGKETVNTRKLTGRYAIGFSVSVVLWSVSVFMKPPFRYWFWGAGLVSDLFTPMTTLRIQAKLPKLSTSHLPERFGLLTILAIGESVIGVVQEAANRPHMTLTNALVVVLGLVLAFCVWWLYFDHIMYRSFRRGMGLILAWTYLHLPIVIGITAIGAGVVSIVSLEEGILIPEIRWLICGSVAGVLIIIGLIGLTCEQIKGMEKANMKLFLSKCTAAVLVLLIGYAGRVVGPLPLLVLLLLILGSQIVQGLIMGMAFKTTVVNKG
jgi:low temperature requirement protein LtrA